MNKRVVKLSLITTPDNLRRNGYVLFAPIDEKREIGLGVKNKWYPEGIYRLPGGGIHDCEGPALSARRELKEELDIDAGEERLIPLVEIIIDANTKDGNFMKSFYCYAVNVRREEVTAGDDIDAVKFITKDEYEKLNLKFETMGVTPKDVHWDIQRWRDYGILFSTIQKIVGEELTKNNLW